LDRHARARDGGPGRTVDDLTLEDTGADADYGRPRRSIAPGRDLNPAGHPRLLSCRVYCSQKQESDRESD
jgi:hypothetical protein